MYDRFFWAGCRISLRQNTCADRLKLLIYEFGGPPKQRPFFFGNAKAQLPRLSPAIIFYGLPDRNWHPFGKILASGVPGAFALNPQFGQERPPLKIFASCST
jgi:hypothetical protein